MILGFKQYFPWHTEKNPAPTYFKEKIYAGVPSLRNQKMPEQWFPGAGELALTLTLDPKIHTFREGNRWKAGDLMHMAYGVRTKNYQQFNKSMPELQRAKSVQKIEIIRDPHFGCIIQVDNRQLGMAEIVDLITNDGFDNSDDFLKWFKKDFVGQIVHFKDDFRY